MQRANISGYLRETQGSSISEADLSFFESLPTPSVSEKCNKILTQLARLHPSPGEQFQLDISVLLSPGRSRSSVDPQARNAMHWLAVAWARDGAELLYLVERYLREATGYLDGGASPNWFQISPKGWQYLSSLQNRAPLEDTAFVAMSFNQDLVATLWTEGIRPGIEAAGYLALRMDRYQHNGRVDDEMVALIRRCKFLVADFTRQSAGVYFEAGFALGLGKPVVWLCSANDLKEKKVHFDTRQYSFVRWEEDQFVQFQEDLRNRIEATIGCGPLRARPSTTPDSHSSKSMKPSNI